MLEEMLGTTSTPRPTRVVGLGGEEAGSSSSQPTRIVELKEEGETTVPRQDPSEPRRSRREIPLPVRY